MTTPIQLADAVQRMLEAQILEPVAERAFVPVLEQADMAETRIIVVPGDVTSSTTSRRGDRNLSRWVDVAVVRTCPPDDAARIAQLIGLCETVGETLARNRPIDENGDPVAPIAFEVNHEPLYSVGQLKSGSFFGVVRARYPG